RGRPGVAHAHRHHPGPRLQVPGAAAVGRALASGPDRRGRHRTMERVTMRPTTARPPAAAVGGRDPRRPFATSPFTRLARTHALGTAGDALFAIALAGTIFFKLDFDQARERTALYLLLTIAPFAVAAPLIGPALDRVRGGRRWVIVACQVLRVLVCYL